MFEPSVIELNASALHHNLKFIRKRLKPGVRLCSVVKGNAYGHGLSEYVGMAMQLGVDYFGVHSADEAFYLKQHQPLIPNLFIMSAVENEAVGWAIDNNVEFAVFDFERLESALQYAKQLNKKALIHIEIETGMYRTGFAQYQIPKLCEWLHNNSNHIIFQGLFTHFAGAESQANDFRVSQQANNFDYAFELFNANNLHPVYHHTSCSAALLNYPERQGNLVRIGILQYGFWPNKETHVRFYSEKENTPEILKRIISWSAKVIAINSVSKGQFVGYGTTYLAPKNMQLAIVPIGYSHGYSRKLSNIGSVLINGHLAPIVGIVNMNSLTVDISRAGEVKKGDEVVLIGKQKGKTISVSSFSEQSDLLNYELLTRLPLNIPRIITY